MRPLWLAPLVGCAPLEAALESPYVLTTGLGEVRSIALLPGDALVVAASTGTVRVDGTGATTPLGPPADAVTTFPDRLVVVSDGQVRWGPIPAASQPFRASAALDVPGARDALGWYDDTALVLTRSGLARLRFDGGGLEPLGAAPPGARGLALSGTPGAVLVVTGDGVHTWRAGAGFEPLVVADHARAAAVDALGQTWLVHGEPAQLSRIGADGTLTAVAHHLGAPVDAHCGGGGLLPATHLYLAGAGGTVDYLPLPTSRGDRSP